MSQQFARVIKIDFAQDWGWQADSADCPIALDGRHVGPIFVPCFQPAVFLVVKHLSVGIRGRWFVATRTQDQTVIDLKIGGKKDSILMRSEEHTSELQSRGL